MVRPWSQYQRVIVETYAAVKAGKSSRIHVRPVAGQPFPTTMDVECSRSMRQLYPLGTRFRIIDLVLSNYAGVDELFLAAVAWSQQYRVSGGADV
jgi:hypothetical protein